MYKILEFNAGDAELLSGDVQAALVKHRNFYVAWTPTKEGPFRSDRSAAMADLRDMIEGTTS